MDTRVVALAIFGILFASSITVLLVGVGEEAETSEPNITFAAGDPCLLYTSPSPRDRG